MREHRTDHPRHRRNGFEHDRPVTIPLGEEGICAEAQQLREAEREPVRKAGRWVVNDGFGGLLRRAGTIIRAENRVDHGFILAGEIERVRRQDQEQLASDGFAQDDLPRITSR